MDEFYNIYELISLNNEYTIYEKSSKINIGKFTNYTDASKLLLKLRNGMGFQGFTPSFVAKSVKNK